MAESRAERALPLRFVDYFVVVGAGDALEPLDAASALSARECFDAPFKARIVGRHPSADHEDTKLPLQVWMLCFPRGLRLRRAPQRPKFFIFVLTEVDGVRLYGAALTIYQPTDVHPPLPARLADTVTKETIYVPVCLCLLSHYPFFSVFKEYLCGLYRMTKTPSPFPVERYIANFIYDVPLPPPGRVRVSCPIGTSVVPLMRPHPTDFPLADISFKNLFEALGVDNVVTLFDAVLCESKILFISRQCTMLTAAAEAITALCYPFLWHHVYVPILSSPLLDFLQAPTPFIMGVLRGDGSDGDEGAGREDGRLLPKGVGAHVTEDILVVDLDTGRLQNAPQPSLPEPERSKLVERLARCLTPHVVDLDLAFAPSDPLNWIEGKLPGPDAEEETKGSHKKQPLSLDKMIRAAFLSFFVPLFAHYRECTRFLRKYPKPVVFFDKPRLLSFQKPHVNPFMESFMETQAFAMFLEHWHLQMPNIFDMAIHHYLYHGDTKLDVVLSGRNRQKPDKTYQVPPPSAENVPRPQTLYTYTSFPTLSNDRFPRSKSIKVFNLEPAKPPIDCYPDGEELCDVIEDDYPISEKERGVSAGEFVDIEMETAFIDECITALYEQTEHELSERQASLLKDLLSLPHGGIAVANRLYAFSKRHSDACLMDSAFETLSGIATTIISNAAERSDFRAPTQLVKVMVVFYHKVGGLPEFLYTKLSGLDLWKNTHFWNFYLYREIQRRRGALDKNFRSSVDDWISMEADSRERVVSIEEKLLFESIGNAAQHMLMVGLGEPMVRTFVTRTASTCAISEDTIATLSALVTNIFRACAASNSQIESLKGGRPATPRTMRQSQKAFFLTPGEKAAKSMRESKEFYAQLILHCQPDAAPKIGDDDAEGGADAATGPMPPRASVSTLKRDGYTVTCIEPHTGGIDCMCVNADTLAAGSSTGPITVWSLAGGGSPRLVAKLDKHADRVCAMRFCEEEGALLSASSDKLLCLWDTHEAKLVAEFAGHKRPLLCLDVNASLTVTGSEDSTVRLWDLRARSEAGVLSGHAGPVLSLQLCSRSSKDGTLVVLSGSEDGTAKLWDLRKLSPILSLEGHSDWVNQVFADGSTIVTSSYDYTLRTWSQVSGACVSTLMGHKGSVTCFDVDTTTGKILSGSEDNTLRLWDMRKGECNAVCKGHTDALSAVKFLPGTGLAVSGSRDLSLRMWDLSRATTTRCLRGHSDWLRSVQVQGSRMISSSWDGSVRLWDVEEPESSEDELRQSKYLRASSSPIIVSHTPPSPLRFKKETVLVTGGAGFIGSHTAVELLNAGHDVVVVDNLCNSCNESLARVERITGKKATFYKVDVGDEAELDRVFAECAARGAPVTMVIHFAGLKAVGESVRLPLQYYSNNITGTLVLLRVMEKHNVLRLIFSSSATVYGMPERVPISEDFALSATNPYGRTKLFIEDILRDWCVANKAASVVLLRYFNPVGAHKSGLIGEDPKGVPNNLMPFVSQVAIGRLPEVKVFGNDYPTPDGTGVRDYIHVVDLATGHLAAIKKLHAAGCTVYNLGLGRGYSVLEMIEAMRKTSGKEIKYSIVGRRAGDVAAVWADTKRAETELGWKAVRGLEEMCEDLWRWQQQNPNGFSDK
eukprot:m51a1_g2929 putative udp-glucose 4-epimerase (1618) ;mRNA; r:566998-574824